MENFHFTKEQMDQKKDELVKAFHLEPIWNKKTTELSHGECQRLVLASLLAINPKVLLLDEPTAFLDPAGREDFYRWLGIIKGSQTVIIVDHHLNEVLPFVDKILNVSAEGEVSIDGSDSVTLPIFNQDLARLIKPHQIKAISELKISGLSFHYPDQKKLLENVSLNLKSGEISVIKGKNGKGKSTLFKIIAGMIKPISGKVEIHKNNKLIVTKKNFLEIGFVFQNPESHFFYDTIAEEFKNVADKENLKYFLSLFFKNINLSSSPFLLSEGEKRRLSILMTVILNKTIILYDEPTFGQDEESILIIKEMILFLQKLGKIQIIISHDHSFINSLEAQVFDLQDEHLTREA